jgi:hypothetical protein
MTGPAHTNLYETDFIAWAEGQAAALRAIPDPSPFGLDLANLIEEVEALARRDLLELEERLRSAMTGLLLSAFEPDPELSLATLAGVSRPLIEARKWRSPTGISRLDPDLLWSEAWEEAAAGLPAGALGVAPGPCPFRAEELLARGFSPQEALSRVRQRLSGETGEPALGAGPA